MTGKESRVYKTTKKILIAMLSAFLMTLAILQPTQGSELQITMTTDKQSYNLGETVLLAGNLTLDGSPVSDLVSIQVQDPCVSEPKPFIMRTLPTGPNIPDEWPIKILSVIPIGSDNNPKYNFRRGRDYIGFNITVQNYMMETNVTVTITTYYSDGVPFASMEFATYTPLQSGPPQWSCLPDLIAIPENAPLGVATVFVSVFTWPKLPKDGGFAYCPEEYANFNIISGTLGSTVLPTSPTFSSASTPGNFNTTFRIPPMYGKLGNYTVYATSRHEQWVTISQIKFGVVLISDITSSTPGVPDGKVNIRDVALVASGYGARHVTDPASPKYCQYWHDTPCRFCPHNPKCDLYKDNKINVRDIAIVAQDYGKIGILSC